MIMIAAWVLFLGHTAEAYRLDVRTPGGQTVSILRLRIVLFVKDYYGDSKFSLFYDENERALYFDCHGSDDGKIHFQERRESIPDTVDRMVRGELDRIGNRPIDKIYLMSCYQAARHKKNPEELYIGESKVLGCPIVEMFQFHGVLTSVWESNKTHFYAICYDGDYNDLSDKFYRKNFNAVMEAAKDAKLKWAVRMLRNIKKGRLKTHDLEELFE
jgi:hypothetical protein